MMPAGISSLAILIRQFLYVLRRYNDGEALSADDQSFVLENVFNYHPDKAVKMGDGVDYITVCCTYH